MVDIRAFTADLLDSHPEIPGAHDTAQRLRARMRKWTALRLWSINLAPELVLHDDRHVSQVDRLVARLAEPFLDSGRLTLRDVESLSCAAWLHDWGHIGGPAGLSVDGKVVVVTSPGEVRSAHGLVSQELLAPAWSNLHSITEPVTALTAGVLCAHHQGWSSFGSLRPEPRPIRSGVADELLMQPRSLDEDVERLRAATGGTSEMTLARAQLLVALLRCADAADVGRHRVPDAGPAKGAFLAHCVRMQAWQARDEAAAEVGLRELPVEVAIALDVVAARSAQLAQAREDTADAGEVILSMIDELTPLADRSEAVRRLIDYIRFTVKQGNYVEAHRRVSSVDFVVRPDMEPLPGARNARWAISVKVTPARGVDPYLAVGAVLADIERELDCAEGDDSVRAVLHRAGVRFTDAFASRRAAAPHQFRLL